MEAMKMKILPGERRGYQCCKRLFDLLFSLAALLVLLPLMLIIALLIRLQDGGKPLFSQIRLGRGGRPIRIWKFRSMRADAEEQLETMNGEHRLQYEAEYKIDNDPRVTRLGAFLRRTSLDELPQLWNILRGEMSFVGPRPVLPDEINRYQEGERKLFHSVPPGLTGYWQACSGPEDTYTTGGRQRMELWYAAHATFGFDLLLILKTFGTVVRKAGKS